MRAVSRSAGPVRRRLALFVAGLGVAGLLALFVPFGARATLVPDAADDGFAMLLGLALPVYLTGVLSLLSPCCLPILPAYFSITFGARRGRVVAMSVAFFCGLATTMVVLGASFTALGAFLFPYRELVARIGGIAIVAFGIATLLGFGFSGLRIDERPAASLGGSYLYGLTFAFGWTACVGPILGAVLTALVTSGLTVLAGAALAFVYALGLATPLTIVAALFNRLGTGSRAGRLLRGHGFSVRLGRRTLHLHTTSLLSGTLLVMVGVLLASGQLSWFTQRMSVGWGAQIALWTESWLARLFGLGQ